MMTTPDFAEGTTMGEILHNFLIFSVKNIKIMTSMLV